MAKYGVSLLNFGDISDIYGGIVVVDVFLTVLICIFCYAVCNKINMYDNIDLHNLIAELRTKFEGLYVKKWFVCSQCVIAFSKIFI
jgi:hypothetical protein